VRIPMAAANFFNCWRYEPKRDVLNFLDESLGDAHVNVGCVSLIGRLSGVFANAVKFGDSRLTLTAAVEEGVSLFWLKSEGEPAGS